jgi:hypothetical protein
VNASPPIPRHVFTPEWLAQVIARYDGSSEYQRPSLYHFWTSPDFQDRRDVLERAVDLLSPEKRAGVIERLRDPELFHEVRTELAVGESLRRTGCDVEYGPLLAGQTPDWYVRPRTGAGDLIVEVVSSQPPEDRSRADEGWWRLCLRLQELDGNVHLAVVIPLATNNPRPPDESWHVEIVREVRRWLDSKPAKGAERFVPRAGVNVILIERRAGPGTVTCGLSLTPYWVDAKPLAMSVRKKAKRYKPVAAALGLPFILCVVPDIARTGRRLEELEDVVLGERGCRPTRDPQRRIVPEYYRKAGGVFSRYPTLSAVTLGTWWGEFISHMVIHNPNATHPLTDSVFGE